MPSRVCVIGAGGRVGLELLSLINQSESFVAASGVGHKADGFRQNVHSISQVEKGSVDIIIDFSSPELFDKALEFCVENKIPFVSGTTGLSSNQHHALKQASLAIPVLWAPNMSLGIAVMKNALKVFKATKDFDFQVEEWHHRHKKDRPSGTAIHLQQELESVIGRACPPPMVMRGGGIFGVHKVYAVSDEEILQIEHTAINRTVFARGAMVAAQWLLQKPSGLYKMEDVIS
jgi:4-hydroxy-tetrahydrodipicolinate reductase